MLDIFFKSDYDDRYIIVYKNKKYTVKDMKMYIAAKIEEIKSDKKNIIISSDNSFAFFINFFASIFADKNIILLPAKNNTLIFETDALVLNDDFKTKIADYKFPHIDIDKPSINCYTSGTSDKSKCIQKSLYNLMTEANDIADEFGFKNKEYTVISSTNMCHLYGLTFHLMMPLTAKLKICMDKIIYPELGIKDCIFVSTPSFLNYFEKHNIVFEIPPKYIISAGSKLPEKTFEYLEKISKVIEIYGSTEAGATAYKLSSMDKMFKLFPKVNVSKSEDGNLFVTTNYSYKKKIAIGDSVDIIDGKISLKERTDRVVKIYEKRINLEEYEYYLKKSDYITDAYCFKHNEKLAALIVLSNNGKKYLLANGALILQKMLKQYCSQNFDIMPQRWKFLSEVPTNQSGKIDKIFIDNLFSVKFAFPIVLDKRIDNEKFEYELFLPRNSSFYDGHFPNNPITPGVVLLYIAQVLSRYTFKYSDISYDMRRIKFLKIMKPDEIVHLSLRETGNNIEFTYEKDDTIFSSGNFPFVTKKE